MWRISSGTRLRDLMSLMKRDLKPTSLEVYHQALGSLAQGGESKHNALLDLVLQWQNGAYTNACIPTVQESEDQKRRINHGTGFASHFISHHLRRIGEFADHGYVPRTTTCIDCRRLCAGRKVYELQHGATRAARRSAADVDRGRAVLVSRRD